jgi:hypothetical protein
MLDERRLTETLVTGVGGCATTLSVAAPETPLALAVIVVEPTPIVDTVPAPSTVATAVFELVHATEIPLISAPVALRTEARACVD